MDYLKNRRTEAKGENIEFIACYKTLKREVEKAGEDRLKIGDVLSNANIDILNLFMTSKKDGVRKVAQFYLIQDIKRKNKEKI
jgi:hypothetical protein